MSESAADLAATVRDVLSGRLGTHEAAVGAMDALDALLARCQEAERFAGELERQNEHLADALATEATDREVEHYNRAVAAEAERDEARRQASSDYVLGMRCRAEEAEARVAELEQALREFSDHQSWRCGHPDLYSQDPDCPCGLVKTWRDLGFAVEYDAEGRAALQSGGSEGGT